MIRLKFNVFQKRIEQASSEFPILHYLEEPTMFTLSFKTKDGWGYYTVVTDLDIINFAESVDMPVNMALAQFKMAYCSNAIPLTNEEIKFIENDNSDYFASKIPKENEEIIEEAEDYSDFLKKMFNMFERKTLLALNTLDLSKTNKTFGDFLKHFFDYFNTRAFVKNVRKYIGQDLLFGIEAAEEELNIDIGKTKAYEQKLNQLASQQVDGYTINGKKWFGIKGVTKEIQAKITKTVQTGINESKTIDEIKADVSSVYDKFTDNRSEMIAITETNRIISEGQLLGYKESGIEGGKIPLVADDGRTSEICLRMKATYGDNPIPLDADFIDPKTNKAYRTPPFHIRCRTRIGFRPT